MTKYHHHSQEEKQKAIDLYISNGFSPSKVERELGYPCKSTLLRWYNDYRRRGYVRGPKKWEGKYSEAEKRRAVEHYLATGKNVSKTIREIGYSGHSLLCKWIDEFAPGKRKTTKSHGKFTEKERLAILEEANSCKPKELYEKYNISPSTFYNWRRTHAGKSKN